MRRLTSVDMLGLYLSRVRQAALLRPNNALNSADTRGENCSPSYFDSPDTSNDVGGSLAPVLP